MLARINFKHTLLFVVDAVKKKEAYIVLMNHLLTGLKYQNEKFQLHDCKLVYPSTSKNIKK